MKEQSIGINNETGLLNAEFFDNPYPTFSKLRYIDPIHWSEERSSWLVTRYQDVRDYLRDPRLSAKRDKRQITQLSSAQRTHVEPLRDFYSNWLLYLDAPDHTRLRKSVSKVFTPAVIEKRKDEIETMTNDTHGKLLGKSKFDLLHDFASPLAIAVVANTLGMDAKDYEKVKTWSDDIVGFVVGKTEGYDSALAAQESFEHFSSHLNTIFSTHEIFPHTSVLSSLMSAQTDGIISRREASAIYGNLLLDGHEPIANGIANGMLSLMRHPQQMDLLRRNPDLGSRATEELLRYESPFPLSARLANEDIGVGNKKISKGQKIFLMLGSANRDPEYFSDPDNLDLTRDANKHLTFAAATHYCLGATLARPTLQIAYRSLLEGFPSMKLAKEKIEWQPSLGVRELKGLPVIV